MKRLLLLLLLAFAGCQDKTWVNCHLTAAIPDSPAIKVRRDSVKEVVKAGDGRYYISVPNIDKSAQNETILIVVDKEDEWKLK